VAFLDTRDAPLIAGDTFTAYGRVAVTSQFYLRFPFAAMASWNKAMVIDSARRLLVTLDPAVLVVGHGPAVRNPGHAMDEAIARAGGAPGPAAAQPRERALSAIQRLTLMLRVLLEVGVIAALASWGFRTGEDTAGEILLAVLAPAIGFGLGRGRLPPRPAH
jgi:hypothetical protein